MFKFNIIAKMNEEGVEDGVNIINSTGKNHTLYYRLSILGFNTGWIPVRFMNSFPD